MVCNQIYCLEEDDSGKDDNGLWIETDKFRLSLMADWLNNYYHNQGIQIIIII